MTDSPPLPGWAPRQADLILGILEHVVEGVRNGTPADRTLHELLSRDRKFGSRDRRVIGDAVFAWFRWHGATGDLPYPEGLCAAWALEQRDWPPALRFLREQLGWPEPPASIGTDDLESLRESVITTCGVNLAPVQEWLPTWYRDESAHLGSWEERIRDHLHRPPTWIRVDSGRQAEFHATLLADGAVWAGERSPCAYAFDQPGTVNRWMQQHADAIEIQDLGSQQVARICDPKPGQTWWDACCGAGGKTLQLLDLADRSLDLTCTDRREGILSELVKRGRRHGTGKVRRYALDLLNPPQLPNIAFDGILVDAPCSGTGTWNRNPDDAWRTEHKDVEQHARRQVRMLETVLPVLKAGGHLIYAVCSLTRSETTGVVAAFLEAHPDIRPAPFDHPLTGEATDGTLTLLPGDTRGDGMFIARFVKKG